MRHFYRYYEKSSIVTIKRESYFGADSFVARQVLEAFRNFLFGSTFLIFDFLVVPMSLVFFLFFLFFFFISYKIFDFLVTHVL